MIPCLKSRIWMLILEVTLLAEWHMWVCPTDYEAHKDKVILWIHRMERACWSPNPEMIYSMLNHWLPPTGVLKSRQINPLWKSCGISVASILFRDCSEVLLMSPLILCCCLPLVSFAVCKANRGYWHKMQRNHLSTALCATLWFNSRK